jgi:uncharacterized protein (TIGR03067 family)
MGTKLLMALVGGLLLGADGQDQAKGDKEKLQGRWVVTSGVMDGTKIPKDQIKGDLVFKGNTYTYTAGDSEAGDGTFKIDPSKKPKFLNSVPSDGPVKGQTIEEIYELDGDNLKICLSLPGNNRPTEFTAPEGSGRWLFTYKRAK